MQATVFRLLVCMCDLLTEDFHGTFLLIPCLFLFSHSVWHSVQEPQEGHEWQRTNQKGEQFVVSYSF